MFGSMFVSMPVFMSLSKSVSLSVSISLSSDADPVELLYGSGSRIRKSSIQIRIRIQGKNLTKFNFSKFCGKKRTYRYRKAALYKIGKGPKRTAEVTEELQSSMRMAKVTGGQLRSHEVI